MPARVSRAPHRLAFVALLAVALAGCGQAVGRPPSPADSAEGAAIVAEAGKVNPWTSLRAANDPAYFHFAIFGDRTGGNRAGVFEEGVRKLNLLAPEFVVFVGDMIEGKTEDAAKLDAEWAEARGIVAALRMPLFVLPGNHDITNDMMASKWAELWGPTYYHFTYRGVLFLALCTEDGGKAHISDEQVAYVSGVLAADPTPRWTFVFMHEPLWLEQKPTGWAKVDALLGRRPATVFAGHDHGYMEYVRGGRKQIKLAPCGGASGLAGPAAGEFDEVVWVTMGPQGPQIANLALDGVLEDDFLTEDVAKLSAALRGGAFAQPEPILVDGNAFASREIKVSLTNPGDQPLKFRGTFQNHPSIEAIPQAIEKTVPPKGSEAVTVRLQTARPLPLLDLAPVELKWTATYEIPGRPALTSKGSQLLVPEKVLPVARRDSPVTVDGRLDEWKDLPFECTQPVQVRRDATTWQGKDDGSFRFAVQHDAKFLYIAIDVTDEALVLDPEKAVWDQDGLEVRVDARPDPARSASRGQGENQDFLLVALSPGRTPNEMVRGDAADSLEGMQVACVKTKKGYAAEIAIPVAWLDEKQGGAWKELRLNIALDDFDSPTDKGTQLWWRPDWRTRETYAGSGTFKKQ